jgi:hypothetical protein
MPACWGKADCAEPSGTSEYEFTPWSASLQNLDAGL